MEISHPESDSVSSSLSEPGSSRNEEGRRRLVEGSPAPVDTDRPDLRGSHSSNHGLNPLGGELFDVVTGKGKRISIDLIPTGADAMECPCPSRSSECVATNAQAQGILQREGLSPQ